jgi:phospholipid/cholesterol/gamma-HCH transport system substrate-binding protein
VEKIRVAPDNRLIGVVMKLDLPDVEGKVVSQLKAAGITGMIYVELNQRMPDEPDLSPRIEFAAEYPIIPSRPSQLKQILSAVDMVVDKIKLVDIVGISNQIKDSMKSVETFLKDRKFQSVLVNLESTTTKLDSTIGRIDAIIAAGDIEATLLEAKTTFSDTRTLIADVQGTLEAMKLPETVSHTAGKAQQLVDDLDRRSRKIAVETEVAVENLRRASENLDRLIERLSMNPSDIIFSEPPVPQQRE